MSWIRLEDGYSDHDKIVDFAAIIGNPLAEAYLTRLWTWACRNRQSGDLSGMKPSTLAHIVRFPGDPQELVDALHQCRLLDADWKIHNWHVYQGAIIEKREADRERSRAKWASRPKKNESRESRGTVAGQSRDSRETVEGLSRATVRDGTVRDETKNEEMAPAADAAAPAPEGKPIQEPLLSLPVAPKKPRKLSEEQVQANEWRSKALAIAGISEAEAGPWPSDMFLAWKGQAKRRTVATMMKALDGIARLPVTDFTRKRGWTHWIAGEGIDAGLAALGATIASGGSSGRPVTYFKPDPVPEWTPEMEIEACKAFSRGNKVRKFTVPKGRTLPEGFDPSVIPDRHLPIEYADFEVQP